MTIWDICRDKKVLACLFQFWNNKGRLMIGLAVKAAVVVQFKRAMEGLRKRQIDDRESRREGHPWKEGEQLTFVRVRFPGNTRSFPFLVGKRQFQYGQRVLAMSDRGMDVGYINSFPYRVIFKESLLPIRSISRVAEEEDLKEQQDLLGRARMAQNLCKDLVEKLGLDMTVTHVENIQFGKKMVFYFNAPTRIDFRELVKSLVGRLGLRVELRQISVRDRTAAMGSIGSCGLMTCCSSFLQNYGRVSIKMAKNQSLSLVADKVNGVCGQLKCCIKYENEIYSDKRHQLPSENNLIQTANGDKGKVIRLHLMREEFEMLTDKGQLRRYAKKQYLPDQGYPEGETFPKEFEHVVMENKELIGGEEEKAPSPKEGASGMEPWGDGRLSQNVTRAQSEEGDASSQPSSEKNNKDKEKSKDEDDFEGEEETEEDKLALKKAQSLSLEDQEKAAQGAERSSFYRNKKGGSGGNRKGKNKGRRPFPRNKRNKKTDEICG